MPSALRGRTYEEIYGPEKAREMKEKRRKEWEKKKFVKKGHNVPHTEEAKQKISESKKGTEAWNKDLTADDDNRIVSGADSHLWEGGKKKKGYTYDFYILRHDIRERDNHQCQMCPKIEEEGKAHDVHHIDYDKKNNQLENLITLCGPCHIRTNQNREYWKKHFAQVISKM